METALLLRLCIATPAVVGVTVRNSSSRKVKYSQAAAELYNCKKPSLCWEGGGWKSFELEEVARGLPCQGEEGVRGQEWSQAVASTYLLRTCYYICCLRTGLLNSQFTIHMYIKDSDVFRL